MKKCLLVVCAIGFLTSCSTVPEKQNDHSVGLVEKHEKNPRGIASSFAQMAFVPVTGGTFKMGSPTNEVDRRTDERQHDVTLTKDFEIGATEVTQLQWVSVRGSNPSYFKEKMFCPESFTQIRGVNLCPDLPVDSVSWKQAQEFIVDYNFRVQDGYRYSLPTEAQWEFAARAGTDTKFSFGDNQSQLGEYSWYQANSGKQTHTVASKAPNAWGLYDMHGNVWEWVLDGYQPSSSSAATDPIVRSSDSYRVIRGGYFDGDAPGLRSALRLDVMQDYNNKGVGFRLVRVK